MNTTYLRIGEVDSRGSGGATFSCLNPITREIVSECAAATPTDAAAAASAAAKAFPDWSETGPNTRRAALNEAANRLDKMGGDVVETMVRETCATRPWAGFNVAVAAGMLREAAALTTQVCGRIVPSDRPGTMNLAVRRPVGPMLAIAPWNAPVILAARAVAMPLACGNTVVLKGSERCPQTHRLLVDALIGAGIPAGAVNYINNAPQEGPKIVETLIDHPAIRRINFTGSTGTGKHIAMMAARNLKPVLLELGGKAPLVVLSDANIEDAAKGAAFGSFFNQGQICMSTERIVVDEQIADQFVEAFVQRSGPLRAGDPLQSDCALGALVDPESADFVRALVADARAKGGRVILEGPVDKNIMQPIVVDGVTEEMRLWREESFGPVVAIARASGDDALVRLANDSEYGLSAAVYGSDISRLLSVAGRIDSGICHINAPTVFDEPHVPFGGVRDSGYGRFGGYFSIDHFTETRWISLNSAPVHLPF